MPAANKHLDNVIENFYRRDAMHIAIYFFIDTYRFLYQSVTLEEAAQAFVKRHKINEDLYSKDTVVSVYLRVRTELNDIQKHKDQIKAFPIKVG